MEHFLKFRGHLKYANFASLFKLFCSIMIEEGSGTSFVPFKYARTFQVRQNLSSTLEPLEYDCFT